MALCSRLVSSFPHMPTLPDYPGVSRIRHWSPALPYGSPNLSDKMAFLAFLCCSLKFSPIFPLKIRTFFIHCTVSGRFFARISVTDKDYFAEVSFYFRPDAGRNFHTRNNYFLSVKIGFFFSFINQRKTWPLFYSLSYVMHTIDSDSAYGSDEDDF